MKWNELPDEAKLVLREDLMFIPEDALDSDQLYTRKEILEALEVAYPIGTVLTYNREDQVLVDASGGVVAEAWLDVEIEDRFEIQQ